jgi:hypothetical protein
VDIEGVIRKKLSIRFSLPPEVSEEAGSIESCNAVCLGIRRFKDVPDRIRLRKKILGMDYYQKGIQIIEDLYPDPHFFIFTQDTDWAKQNLPTKEHRMTFIKGKDPHRGAVVDLWLMTLCKHYVISNSTLHWWGAWLSAQPDKTVIVPKSGWDNKDILPPSWTTIE